MIKRFSCRVGPYCWAGALQRGGYRDTQRTGSRGSVHVALVGWLPPPLILNSRFARGSEYCETWLKVAQGESLVGWGLDELCWCKKTNCAPTLSFMGAEPESNGMV